MSELKKCPCCNGEAKLVKKDEMVGHGSSTTLVYVKCTECGLRTAPHDTYLEGTEAVVKAIAEWNTRSDGWIGVKDRLPEEHQKVLVYVNGFLGYFMDYARFDGKNFISEEDNYDSEEVEYWFSFPEPPKGD